MELWNETKIYLAFKVTGKAKNVQQQLTVKVVEFRMPKNLSHAFT